MDVHVPRYMIKSLLLFICSSLNAAGVIKHNDKDYISNLALFPGQTAWCQLKTMKQVISHPGCETKEISNAACFGQCYSYSIPHETPTEAGGQLDHWECCTPLEIATRRITLRCHDDIKEMEKVVDVVESCQCQDCAIVIFQSMKNKLKGGSDEFSNEDDMYEYSLSYSLNPYSDYDYDPSDTT